jgi:hypothetical protein
MLRAIGKEPPHAANPADGIGGTGAYHDVYARVAVPFDPTAQYPVGTLLGRNYRNVQDQGHVAVVVAANHILEAAARGVTNVHTPTSYGAHFFEYAVLPKDWLAPNS